MPRALLSVYDKTGLIDFARRLVALGWDLVASGGTERALIDAGLPVTSVEQVTGFPEMLGGRVKTLHPAIFGAILARNHAADNAELEEFGFAPITLVACNLYPFQQTVAVQGTSLQDAIEQIDIGGVSLLRAAAKNFMRTTVVCDPADYPRVAAALERGAAHDLAMHRELAVKAFAHTRDYDTAIHAYLETGVVSTQQDALPERLSIGLTLVDTLRYGENPHQVAGYYARSTSQGPLGGTVLGGKQLSYNNIMDLDAAWRAACTFDTPSVVIVKHMNPCGVATGPTLADAFPLALASDPVSAFGGVIAVNRPVDGDFVTALGSLFVEAIAAPDFTPEAVEMLSQTRKTCRLLRVPRQVDGSDWEIRSVHRGFLVQQVDLGDPDLSQFQTVTDKQVSAGDIDRLRFAWKVVQHVKSNAIVLAQEGRTVGIGGGLPSRVDAVKIAVSKAGEQARGAVLASDAFFPFADGVQAAAAAGVVAVIQPGGSIRDAEVIRAANEAGIAMIFTGVRHFRH
jgi:phosphoribosylaminoimidazolecarboxamide formyltransferase / IMP cyclohydrolase